jgi:hypothetical protein
LIHHQSVAGRALEGNQRVNHLEEKVNQNECSTVSHLDNVLGLVQVHLFAKRQKSHFPPFLASYRGKDIFGAQLESNPNNRLKRPTLLLDAQLLRRLDETVDLKHR